MSTLDPQDRAGQHPLRVCTCGGSDYVSCLCNLTPREWLAYAKTNPRVDQGLTLPKGLQR